MVHELAHQWFGDAVTVAQWRDLWLAEGFATYFEYLWAVSRRPARPRGRSRPTAAFAVENGVGPAVVSRPQDLFDDNTYYRGALTLHALRLEVGDESSERSCARYYRTYRNGNATSADFIDAAAGIGGARVRPLLRAWLYEQPVPPLPGRGAHGAGSRQWLANDRRRMMALNGLGSASGARTRLSERRGVQLSRSARRKLFRIGSIRYSNMVRSPVMIMASAGMPALRCTSGVFFCTSAMST